jgi:hypothetical protein
MSWVGYTEFVAWMAAPGLVAIAAAVFCRQGVLFGLGGSSSGHRLLAAQTVAMMVGVLVYFVLVLPLWQICTGSPFPVSFYLLPLYGNPLIFYASYIWGFQAQRSLAKEDLRMKWQMLGISSTMATCLGCFLGMMYMYDSSETAKPQWIEWLG